jgi:arginyl-tRNA--protein-N-Asp/Glu arginylyltransferase
MKPHSQPSFKSVSIYATGEHPCAYLPERRARTLFVDPRQPMTNSTYSALVDQGFRRSGEYVYKPGCNGCKACKSLRIPVYDFPLSRRHRRCLAANSDLRVHVVPAAYREEHYRLYQRYITDRHSGSQMADPTIQQYMDFLTASWCNSVFYEFREGQRLLAVSAVDELANGLSAVYTFYEPTLPKRSLGTLAIVWLINEARQLRLPYLYLGYWIQESEKMRYKSDFRPHEIYQDGEWQRIG